MDRRQVLMLLGFLAAVAIAATGGAASTVNASDQYAMLEQPSWAPPSWLFGPVWTVLYIMIGVAGWMLWRDGGWGIDTRLWIGQLAMNALWSPLFFAWELRGLALGWILGLDALVAVLIWRNRNLTGYLMMPYMAWIAFATCLNGAVWWLNR